MGQTKLKPPSRQIHIRQDTYKTLGHLAVDRDQRMIEVAEEVIQEGLKVVRSRLAEAPTSAN